MWGAINGGVAPLVIPQDSIPNAISTLSASSSLGAAAAPVCLVIGHDDGRLSFWENALHCEEDYDGAQRSPKRTRYTSF